MRAVRAALHHRTGNHLIAFFQADGDGFAGDHALVDQRGARQHLPVNGDQFSRPADDHVAHRHIARGNLDLHAFPLDPHGLLLQAQQTVEQIVGTFVVGLLEVVAENAHQGDGAHGRGIAHRKAQPHARRVEGFGRNSPGQKIFDPVHDHRQSDQDSQDQPHHGRHGKTGDRREQVQPDIHPADLARPGRSLDEHHRGKRPQGGQDVARAPRQAVMPDDKRTGVGIGPYPVDPGQRGEMGLEVIGVEPGMPEQSAFEANAARQFMHHAHIPDGPGRPQAARTMPMPGSGSQGGGCVQPAE
nr:hypothetical protein [Desulfolutivibrio sulfodismutans]